VNKDAERRQSANDIFKVGKIIHKWNNTNPCKIARYLALEIVLSPSDGARKVGDIIELGYREPRDWRKPPRDWNKQRFVARMLIALGKVLLKGGPVFDGVPQLDELDCAIIQLLLRFKGRISNARMIAFLPFSITGSNPDKKFRDMLKKRVKRLRQANTGDWWNIPL